MDSSHLSKRSIRILITVVGVALSLVIVAPVALSSQDLYAWASADNGLGLPGPVWPLLVFLALDACAVVCIAVTVIASWIGIPAPFFSVLVWLFASTSALANFRQGSHTGGDSRWFFPAMALLGPMLLEACLSYLRKVIRRETAKKGAERLTAARWLLAPITTWCAWRRTVLDRRLTISMALDLVDRRRDPALTKKGGQQPVMAPRKGGQTGPRGSTVVTPIEEIESKRHNGARAATA